MMKRNAAIENAQSVRRHILARHGHDARALLKHYQDLEKRFAAHILKVTHFVMKGKNTT
jgi:hypothetical protein